jgi:hypothetical protein
LVGEVDGRTAGQERHVALLGNARHVVEDGGRIIGGGHERATHRSRFRALLED